MIYTKNNNIDVQSTISGTKVAMEIDEAARVHIMNLLTDLYSDPEAAIIREYSTNARDSHVEAGNAAPIEITTPTSLNPVLRIRDYGIGLDAQGIADIYSKYGASTKRDSNDFNGMLGLGCKSALTYTSQFTLIGVKNGMKTPVVIGREEDGTGSMTWLDPSPTTEPNGVEIQIPVKNVDRINDKVKAFFRFWTPGTVLVDGEQPEPITGLKVTDEMIVVPTELEGQDYVVMGNVAYPADLGIFNAYGKKTALVAYVEIGDVAFTPSREALYECPQTDETLAAIKECYKLNIDAAVTNSIADAADAIEAFKLAAQWRSTLNRKITVTYQGAEVPADIEAPDNHRFTVSSAGAYKPGEHDRMKSVPANSVINGLFVYDFHVNFTAAHKKKLVKYCEQQGIDPKFFILSPHKPDATFIPADKIIDYADVKAVKLEYNRSGNYAGGRLKGSYDIYIGGSSRTEVPADKLDTSKGICYLDTTLHGKEIDWTIAQALKDGGYKGTLVLLTANRVDKFNRDFPKAKTVGKVLAGIYNRMVKKVTERDVLIEKVRSEIDSSWRQIDPATINDPALREALMMRKEATSPAWKMINDTFCNYQIRRIAGVETYTRQDVEFNDPTDDYKVAQHMLRYCDDIDHVVLYLNAVYADKLIKALDPDPSV